MTSELRQAMVERKPEVQLSGEVEFDEVYVTAGHKGNPAAVQKKAKRSSPQTQRASRSGYARNGKATHLRHDSARGRCRDPNAA
jgi:hypothetical protein